jgi:hypothetical protein
MLHTVHGKPLVDVARQAPLHTDGCGAQTH